MAALAAASTLIGVSGLSVDAFLPWTDAAQGHQTLLISRLPRTAALILSGTAMSVAGMLMQMLARNKFVEPSTAGTVEAAGLGLLVVTMLAPSTPLLGKMVVACVFAIGGTAIFLQIVRLVPLQSVLVVPLIGIMLGGVIASVATFFAYRNDLLQTLNTWMTGDFSGVISGRYELLWLTGALTVVAYLAADRFTVAGLGEEFTVNLGMNFRVVLTLGLIIVSVISAVVVVTVGAIPFLGLIVPNVVSLMMGDNMRRALPWVAIFGAAFVLVCDIVGRTIRYPYEIPVGVIVGVVGGVGFLYLLLRRPAHVG